MNELKQISAKQTELSRKLDSTITKDDLKASLEQVKNELCQNFNEQLEKLESKIVQIEIENENLKKENTRLKKENIDMKEDIKNANISATIALTRTNNLEQHTRKDNIRLFGVPDENKNEKVEETIEKTVQILNKIGVSVSKADVSIAHRLGSFDISKRRPIIAKFVKRTHKMQALQNRRKLKGSGIGISEDLTKENYTRMWKVKSHDNVETAWTKDGVIFAKLKSGDQIKRIINMEDCLP